MHCRFCGTELKTEFIDLVNSPPSNSFLTAAQCNMPEVFYPLRLFVCHNCFLVQIGEHKACRAIFSDDYIYYSSFSSSWLRHAENYVEMIVSRLGLDASSEVLEIASNDGYLLQYFVARGIPCCGIEPSAKTGEAATKRGVKSLCAFFSLELATRLKAAGHKPDLIIGNNVLAHVPDIRDFVQGLKMLLPPRGLVTMEFPHLMRLVAENQFDTIYHEHFSYFSLTTVRRIFAEFGLTIFDVQELPTHGGSLRIYAGHPNVWPETDALHALCDREAEAGLGTLAYYEGFQAKADTIKNDLLAFLIEQKRHGRSVAGYGAAAKGNTLLTYAGVRQDLLPFIVDISPHKQSMFLPATHIPVTAEEQLVRHKPDFILILPWNIKEEIMAQLSYVREWGARFLVAVPGLQVF